MAEPRILIVEDDAKTAKTYQRALNHIGDCKIVEHSNQVLEQIGDFAPQVLLLDVVLEDEGENVQESWDAGVRVLAQIRKLPSPVRELLVIVVTGRIDTVIETQCRELGVVAFLRKPVALEDLRQAVEEALEKSGQECCGL